MRCAHLAGPLLSFCSCSCLESTRVQSPVVPWRRRNGKTLGRRVSRRNYGQENQAERPPGTAASPHWFHRQPMTKGIRVGTRRWSSISPSSEDPHRRAIRRPRTPRPASCSVGRRQQPRISDSIAPVSWDYGGACGARTSIPIWNRHGVQHCTKLTAFRADREPSLRAWTILHCL